MEKNLVLTGFMGTGKSAVGRHLAAKLGYNFLDTDDEVETATGLTIQEIFRRYGERRFRAEERIVVEKAARMSRMVIATGGGVVLNRANIESLRSSGLIVLLTARPEVISLRVRHHDVRPLLSRSGELEQQICQLLGEREPYYRDYDYQIDTSDLTIEEIIERILSFLRGRGWDLEGVVSDA